MKTVKWISKVMGFLIITVISVYAFSRVFFVYSEHQIKNEIIEAVYDHLDEMNRYSVKMLNDNIGSGEYKDFKVQRDIDYPEIINYYYKGKGFGSATIYYGVYFIPGDHVDLAFSGLFKMKDTDTWYYEEDHSDKTMYLEKISESFYYYKNTC